MQSSDAAVPDRFYTISRHLSTQSSPGESPLIFDFISRETQVRNVGPCNYILIVRPTKEILDGRRCSFRIIEENLRLLGRKGKTRRREAEIRFVIYK